MGENVMVAQRLAEIRKQKGYSQAEIAKILDMYQQQYSRYEKGVYEIPVRHVITLCKFYGISADWLLGLKDSLE